MELQSLRVRKSYDQLDKMWWSWQSPNMLPLFKHVDFIWISYCQFYLRNRRLSNVCQSQAIKRDHSYTSPLFLNILWTVSCFCRRWQAQFHFACSMCNTWPRSVSLLAGSCYLNIKPCLLGNSLQSAGVSTISLQTNEQHDNLHPVELFVNTSVCFKHHSKAGSRELLLISLWLCLQNVELMTKKWITIRL